MLATAVAASAQITTANAAEIATSRAVKAIAQGPAVDLTPGKQQRDGTKTATSALGEVTLPKSSKDAIRAESADGSVIDLSLPTSKDVEGREVSQSTLIYPNASSGNSVAAQTTATGFRAVVAIDGPSSPSSYEYRLELPAGGWMEVGEDGAIQIYDGDGNPVGGGVQQTVGS